MPSASAWSASACQRAGPAAGNSVPPPRSFRYSQMTRLSYSAWPSSVIRVGTWPSGLLEMMVWSRLTGCAALGSFSIRPTRPVSWATAMHLRTKGEAAEKYSFMRVPCSGGRLRLAGREFAGCGVAQEQQAGGHAEIRAVQLHCTALDAAADRREGHQVLQAVFDHGPFQLLHVGGAVARARQRLGHRGDLRHPFADEVDRGQRLGVVEHGAHAAAGRMAQHHDVFDVERIDREFDGRAG